MEDNRNLDELIAKSFNTARIKGFWDKKIEFGTRLMLVVSELSEALEADRKGRWCDPKALKNVRSLNPIFFEENIKDTVEDEIADTFIRLFDLCGGMQLDIEKHIRLKLIYNSSREKILI